MKKPWIGLLFTLHHCEAVRPSRLLKANGIHKMEYVESLIDRGFAITVITFKSSGRTRVVRYVKISDKGRVFIRELMKIAKKHRLDSYIRYKVINGLYVLDENSRDLLYVLAKINKMVDRVDHNEQTKRQYVVGTPSGLNL